MDTPESPRQSPQSPEEEEEEEKGLSDSELLQCPDEEDDRVVSDSELLQEEENGGLSEEDNTMEGRGGGLDLEDEVVPDFVSDPEDEHPVVETEGMGQEDETIVLMEGDDDVPQGQQLDEDEDRVIDMPQSPDLEPEQVKYFNNSEEDGEDGYDDYRNDVSTAQEATEMGDDEEEDEDKNLVEEDEMRAEERRRAAAVREMKDDSASVSRELDEHELDYDEEVPEEPSIPAHDEEEDEDDTKGDAGEEEESKKEMKRILPPSPGDNESKRTAESKGPERLRRDSFRDKKKEEDDGEIDEGEIDISGFLLAYGQVWVDPPVSCSSLTWSMLLFRLFSGNCTWGMNCRFIHPGVNDKGNYSLITKPDPFSPNGAPPGGPHPLLPNNPWVRAGFPWLRHAKEMLKKATIRKEQEPDFEEKRFNVTIGEDEREFDKENEFFRERSYRIIRDEVDFRDPLYGDAYADPYYDYEMEALWRGGQYENFRVQYTEAPLPYHFERERELRERHRDRERERDHRERERRQRERERERERDKERLKRKEEWERDRLKRDEKERPRIRPPREAREKKEEEKLKPLTVPQSDPSRPDEWKDPWRRSKSPRRRAGLGSPPRGRRRHRPSEHSSDACVRVCVCVCVLSHVSVNLFPLRSLSVSSVSSVSSASSSSSSVRSADSDDMYADLASPVSSASSRSPMPNHPRRERVSARNRSPLARDKIRERPSKKEEPFRDDRRKPDPSGGPPRGGNPVPRSGPGTRGGNPVHPRPGNMGPPGSYGGSGSHKDIKLTLLNKQQGDRGNRKRYLPADKDRPSPPLSKRMAMSPDRGRDKRILGRPPPNPQMDRPRGQGPRPMPPQADRKRPLSPPPKSSGKGPTMPSNKPAALPPAPATSSASGSAKASNTLSRREELLKQLKAVEDAIARKRAKIPTK
uniref:Zinc finger CCCH-type containing 18 n=1 Tax=Nothobranchius furzeri TaxID=105023 RepID=A0A8C6PPT2_NOTFU